MTPPADSHHNEYNLASLWVISLYVGGGLGVPVPEKKRTQHKAVPYYAFIGTNCSARCSIVSRIARLWRQLSGIASYP